MKRDWIADCKVGEKGLDCRLQSRWKTLEHAEDESRKEYIIDCVMLIQIRNLQYMVSSA